MPDPTLGLVGRWFDEPHPRLTAVESLSLWVAYVLLGGIAWLVAAIVASIAFVIAILVVTARRRGEVANHEGPNIPKRRRP